MSTDLKAPSYLFKGAQIIRTYIFSVCRQNNKSNSSAFQTMNYILAYNSAMRVFRAVTNFGLVWTHL